MVDFGFEANLGRFERVLGWECDFDPESALVVRWIILREHSVSERISCVTHAEFRHPLDLLFSFALPSRGIAEEKCFATHRTHQPRPDQNISVIHFDVSEGL